MAHFLVQDNPMDQRSVFQGATRLSFQFDQFQIDILPFQVGHGHDGVHADLGQVSLVSVDDLGRESGHARLDQRFELVRFELEFICDLVQFVHGGLTCSIISFGHAHGMDASIEESFCLFEECTGEHHDAGGSISHFVVLTFGQFDHELGHLVFDPHLFQDGGTVVGCSVVASVSAVVGVVRIFARIAFFGRVLIMTSPSGPCIILSIPLGPNDVLKILDTDLAAAMLARCASIPFSRFFFSCSRRMRKGLPYSSNARLIVASLVV
mmetsp:Transcript_7579/g.46615  ORF Transcript_7579/g.46615 Transcript_7579/m.46615 type:complete len:266 (-) Transcript_7579:6-803(-)